MNFYGLNICITQAKLPAKIWRPKFVHGQHANAVEWFHNWYHVLNIRHLCLELFTNHMVCEAPFLLLYLIDLTLTYVFWFDLDLWVHAKLLKRVNEGCPLVFQNWILRNNWFENSNLWACNCEDLSRKESASGGSDFHWIVVTCP